MLQDLVIAAVNEVIRQVEDTSNAELGKITGGLNLAAQRVGYLVGFASFHLPRIIPQTSARMQASLLI